jgi:hypothetical protein
MPVKKKPGEDLKSIFLAELIERYTYWAAIDDKQAQEYAVAYEKLINVFTTPETGHK